MEDAPVLHKRDVSNWYSPRLGWYIFAFVTLYFAGAMLLMPRNFVPGIIEAVVGAVSGLVLETLTRRAAYRWIVSNTLRAHGSKWRLFFGPPNGYDMIKTLILIAALCLPALISLALRHVLSLDWPWSGAAWGALYVCMWVGASAHLVSRKRWYESLPE